MIIQRSNVTRFFLVRHGQTEWNRDVRFRGRVDLPLDETGLKQASAAADALKARGLEVAAVYASPLQRTMQTAGAVAERFQLSVIPNDGLLDVDFGGWQGLSNEEAAQRYAEIYNTWLERPQDVQFPNGESLEELRQRVTAAVEKLAVEHEEQTVVLVSHMVVCKVLLCAMLGLDNSHYWQVGQDVCAINAFEIDDGAPVVSLINDTCHLKSLR